MAVLGAVFLTAGFALSQTEDATTVLESTKESVIAIIAYGEDKIEIGKGSAVALSDDIVATSYHLVSRAFDVEGVTVKGKKVKIEGILAVDRTLDLAFLKAKGKIKPVIAGDSNAMEEGGRLFMVGSNETGLITVSEGTLRRFVEFLPDQRIMEASLSVPDQFSGGPIFNIDAQLVAMTVILDPRVKFGLPMNLWKTIPQGQKATAFKAWNHEDYFETLEGAVFAGFIASSMGEDNSARSHLEKAVKLNPDLIDIHVRLAEVYNAQRDYSSAANSFRKVTEIDSSRADAFYGLGKVLVRTSRHQEAISALEKAISLNLDEKEVHLEIAGAYEALQDWGNAAEAYERYLSLDPEISWNAYKQLGLARLSLEQYDAAVAALLEANKQKPDDVNLRVKLAEAYQKQGDLAKAEEILNQLAEMNPEEAKYYYSQALRMYDSAGQYEAALEPAKKIIDLNPEDEMAITNLGLMYFRLKRYDESIETFKQCLAVKPDYAYAWLQIGIAYYSQKKFREAIEPYQKYVELAPDDPNGWLNLGVSYMSLKNFEGALEPMKKAVELLPDNANAHYNLAIVYLNLKDNFSAKEVYNTLQSLDPNLAAKLSKYIR